MSAPPRGRASGVTADTKGILLCTDVFQVFMVTHNMVTMMQFDKVFDIEKKCFRSTSDYLNDALPKSTLKKLRKI